MLALSVCVTLWAVWCTNTALGPKPAVAHRRAAASLALRDPDGFLMGSVRLPVRTMPRSFQACLVASGYKWYRHCSRLIVNNTSAMGRNYSAIVLVPVSVMLLQSVPVLMLLVLAKR